MLTTYGDTVTVPAGTGTGWTSGIAFTKDIRIIGNGIDSTTLTLGFTNDSSEEAFFEFTPDATSRARLNLLSGDGTFEVTGFTFAGNNRMGGKFGVLITNPSTTTAIRRNKIHGNKYTSIHRATGVNGDTWGVFYSNQLVNTNSAYPCANENSSWNNNPMTLGSGDGWYTEDNTLSFSSVGIVSGGGQGMGHVVRYNTVTGTHDIYVESHGNQESGIRGTQITEVYGNSFASAANQGFDMRGGRCMVFFNRAEDNTYEVREEYADSYSGTPLTNACPESGPQICGDGCVCMKINHSYMWNNRDYTDNTLQHFVISMDTYDLVHDNVPPELVENREFFTQRATGAFDGTGAADKGGGCGCGTLATMNAITPTLYWAGFWATDQSISDLTGMVGASPATPISGTLYRWSGSAWVAFYTPYTYPHPLRSETTPWVMIYG